MPTLEQRKQNLKVSADALDEDQLPQELEGKMQEARQQIEMLHAQKLEAERQRLEREARELRKQDFLNIQIEVVEKLTSAITTIELDAKESKRELDELEATRKSFKAHVQRIEKLSPEGIEQDELDQFLDQAISTVDKADDEFDQATAYFSNSRRAGIFHGNTSHGSRVDDFHTNLMNGLAFNLPLLILGGLALIVYLAK